MSFPNSTLQAPDATVSDDLRPRFAIGHLSLTADDVVRVSDFYTRLGMRLVVQSDHFAILELRGGTHIVVSRGPAGTATLDLMVGDIDATHADMAAAGAEPTRITRGNPHDRFGAVDPEGNTLHVSSDHSMGSV